MSKDQKNFSILVIEDNTGDYVLIEDYLEEFIEVPLIDHAWNFSEALDFLKDSESKYDVILLDLSLPDKSRELLVPDILNKVKGCPVIVLTGYADMDFVLRSLSAGVADYLIKDDINATALYKSIIYTLERQKNKLRLEESEKRYSNLFHLSPQPMWVYDPETLKFIQVNQAAINYYGYTEEEFLSMTLEDIRSKEDLEKFQGSWDEYKKVKTDIHKGRSRHLKKTGELIEVETYSNDIIINDYCYRSVIAIDVTDKMLIEHKITKAIIKAQEDERYEIGSELHDNICQILATTQICLGMLKEDVNPRAMPWLERGREYIILASEEIRNLSHRLAPAFFNESTIEDEFLRLMNSFNSNNQYLMELHIDPTFHEYRFNRDVQLNFYRILQEQLRNISKHSKASAIGVDLLVKENKLLMQIRDNGQGFDNTAPKKGIGLSNMKRRVELFFGQLDILSAPGEGCEVMVSIPLQESILIQGE